MACNLARSFIWWHPLSDIKFYIATDFPQFIPQELQSKIGILSFKEGELGQSFSSKLYLDKLAPSPQTLFIDSDCLIYGSLEFVFEHFNGNSVSVVGTYISDGEWFGDVKKVISQFNFSQIPKFNGGIYYLEKNELAHKVYEKAREIEPQYDNIGLQRLRGKANDELLMALAMEFYAQKPLKDTGVYMSDPQACPGYMYADVISGKRVLTNPAKPHKNHQSWYPFLKVKPVVIHYLGYYTHHCPYLSDAFILKLVLDKKIPVFIAKLISIFYVSLPFYSMFYAKEIFRPIYRLIFGFRKVKTSDRI